MKETVTYVGGGSFRKDDARMKQKTSADRKKIEAEKRRLLWKCFLGDYTEGLTISGIIVSGLAFVVSGVTMGQMKWNGNGSEADSMAGGGVCGFAIWLALAGVYFLVWGAWLQPALKSYRDEMSYFKEKDKPYDRHSPRGQR